MARALSRRELKPPPKQARAREKQSVILKATEMLVLSGELESISTTSIAVKAGIPVGSIYRYFDDKEDILEQLYRKAYDEVEAEAAKAQADVAPGAVFADTIKPLLENFWHTARAHPSFVPLTRWANRHFSLWDVTPGPASSLSGLIDQLFTLTGVRLPRGREEAIMKSIVTTSSILIDQALEEDDESAAKQLLSELGQLLISYTQSFSSQQP